MLYGDELFWAFAKGENARKTMAACIMRRMVIPFEESSVIDLKPESISE
jgi:hypothetical protein